MREFKGLAYDRPFVPIYSSNGLSGVGGEPIRVIKSGFGRMLTLWDCHGARSPLSTRARSATLMQLARAILRRTIASVVSQLCNHLRKNLRTRRQRSHAPTTDIRQMYVRGERLLIRQPSNLNARTVFALMYRLVPK